jgi:hypothetical protein
VDPGTESFTDADWRELVTGARRYVRERAKGGGAKSGGDPLLQTAYHGTPHRGIEKSGFSLQKIGTGEGAQAYGWGLYFAGKKEVAEHYRKTLSDGTGEVGAVIVSGTKIEPMSPEGHAARLLFYNDAREIKAAAKSWLKEARAGEPWAVETAAHQGLSAVEYYERLNAFLASHKRTQIKVERGQLYTVELPDDNDLLDYEAPIAKQNRKVQDIARTFLREGGYLRAGEDGPRQLASSFREAALELGGMVRDGDGSTLYSMLARKLGSEQAASLYFAEHGVPGMRYKAGQIANVKGGGHNFVIWDEGAIRDTKPLLSKAPKDKLEAMPGPKRENEDYAGEHAAPMSDSGAPAHDVTGGGNFYPEDVYSHNGLRYYGTGEDRMDREAWSQIMRWRGRPNQQITIYRAVPKSAKSPIKAGDWVTTVRAYATEHGRGSLNGDYKIQTKSVRANEIFTNGDSWLEWGYDPQPFDRADHQARAERRRAKAATQADGEGPLLSTAPRTPAQKDALAKAGLPVDERTTLQRLKDKIGEQWQAVREVAGDNIKQRVFDRFDRMRAIEADLGIKAEDSAYLSARLAAGLPSIMEGIMLYGAPEWSGGVLTQKASTVGLLEALKPVEGDINGWLGWMVGRRAQALKAQGRENLMTDADIQALLSLAAGKEAEFKKAALGYLEIKKSILDVAEKAGLIDAGSRATWDSVEYIPFYRADDNDTTLGPGTAKSLSNQSSGIKQLKGGTQNLADPLGNIIRNFTKLVDASLKNNAMLEAVDNYGDTFFEKVGMSGGFEKIPLSEIKKALLERGVPQATIDNMPQGALTGLQKMWAVKPPTDPDVVRIMRDGRPEYYRVPDPDLLQSLTSFKVPSKHWAIKPFIFTKRLLTAGVTSSPEFMLRNFIRDSGSAWVISDDRFRFGWDSAAGVVKPLIDSTDKRKMMFAGGSFIGGQIHGGSPDETAAALRRALRAKGLTSKQIEDHLATVARTPLEVWDRWQKIGSALENANRNAVYEAAIKAGRSPKEAAYMARDLMDFSMQGDSRIVQALADVLPFFNARLQGLYKLYRQGGKKALRKALLVRAGTITTATFALLAWNLLMHAEGYDELEEWDRDTYWHVAPGTQYHIRIPKPFELGVIFATVPERVAMALMQKDRLDQTAKSMMAQVAGTLAMNPVPQFLMPIGELWANKSAFTGRPIENQGDQNLLPEARSEWYTSDTAKLISDQIGNTTGLSPKRIEHLWNGYTGTMGGYALDTVDWLVRQVSETPERPELAWAEMPLLKAVYRGDLTPKSTRYTTEFYALLDKANEVSGTVKEFELAGKPEEAAALEAKWAWLLGEREESKRAKAGFMHTGVREFNKARDRMSDIKKEIEGIVAMPGFTDTQKRELIDALAKERNAKAKEVTTIYQQRR